MREGDVELVQVVTSMTVTTGAFAAIVLLDARLRGHRWTWRAWLPATMDAAILGTFLFSWAYGAPALLVHFIKSRWSLAGVGLGLLWAVLLVAADVGAQLAVTAAIDVLGL